MKQIGNLQFSITLGGRGRGVVDGLVCKSVILRGSDEISLWGRRENSRIWGNSNFSSPKFSGHSPELMADI